MLQAFADYGIGTGEAGTSVTRPPATLAELLHVPAISFLLDTLELAASSTPSKAGKGGRQSLSARKFKGAADAEPEAQAKFMDRAGLAVLLLLRSYYGHVSFATTDGAVSCGLTEAAVDFAAQAAAHEVELGMKGLFILDMRGALLLRRGALPAVPGGLAFFG